MLGTEGEVARAAERDVPAAASSTVNGTCSPRSACCERVLEPRVELLAVGGRIDWHERPVHVLAGLEQALLVRPVERIQHDELPVQS